MIPVIQIRDPNTGQLIPVPALRGESGVYTGIEEPDSNYDVWINPSGGVNTLRIRNKQTNTWDVIASIQGEPGQDGSPGPNSISTSTAVVDIADGMTLGVSNGQVIGTSGGGTANEINSSTDVNGILWGTNLSATQDNKLTGLAGTGSYYGRNILIMGDSTANGLFGEPAFERLMYPKHLESVSVGGARWCDSDGTVLDGNPQEEVTINNTMANQVQKLKNNLEEYEVPDIIVILAGVNDSFVQTPYDEPDIEQYFTTGTTNATSEYIPLENLDRKKFPAAVRYVVENLRNLFPAVQVLLLTPLQTAPTWTLYANLKSVADVIKNTSARLAAPCVDIFRESGVYGAYEFKNAMGKYLRDGLHCNPDGSVLLANKVYDGVTALSFPYRQTKVFTNNLINPHFDAPLTDWTMPDAQQSSVDGVLTSTFESWYNRVQVTLTQRNIVYVPGHKYYFHIRMRSEFLNSASFQARWFVPDGGGTNINWETSKSDGWVRMSTVATATSNWDRLLIVYQMTVAISGAGGKFTEYTEPAVIDLTSVYGEGLEPSQQYMDAIFNFVDLE